MFHVGVPLGLCTCGHGIDVIIPRLPALQGRLLRHSNDHRPRDDQQVGVHAVAAVQGRNGVLTLCTLSQHL